MAAQQRKEGKERFSRSNTAVYNLGYHFIWCPKYRRPILRGDVAFCLREMLESKVEMMGMENVALEIMPDHVHLLLKATPKESPMGIIQQLKGCASHGLRKEFPHLANMPKLWTRSYFVEAVGTIGEETVKRYIENQ